MQLFELVSPRLFRPLAGPNRAFYAELLLLLWEECRHTADYSILRAEAVSRAEDYFAALAKPLALDADDAGDEAEQPTRDPHTLALGFLLRLRRTGALQDGGPTSFFELWRTLPPERLARAEDEAEARRRAEASFITHLQAIAHGRTGLSVSALRQPMPSDPARAADDEAVLRMLWLWVGYVAYDETLSESGEEAVKRFLKRAWPKYHGSRITRSLLETWVQYAKDIKYERDAQACYGGRGWDPRRRR